MPWIACDVTLPREPKTLKLAAAMGWKPKETVGYLLTLWGWCLDFAPDGDLSGFTPDLIADAIGLPAVEGDRLIEALVKSKWADDKPYLRMHDWWSLVGLFLRGRYKNEPQRWKRIQRLYEPGADADPRGEGAVSGSGATLEQVYPTVHNSIEHNKTEPPPPRPARDAEKRDDGEEDASQKLYENLKILKREIIRRSGMRRISPADEEQLIDLLRRHGANVLDACGKLHGGIENIPAYLTRILDCSDDVAAMARRVEALLKKGFGT